MTAAQLCCGEHVILVANQDLLRGFWKAFQLMETVLKVQLEFTKYNVLSTQEFRDKVALFMKAVMDDNYTQVQLLSVQDMDKILWIMEALEMMDYETDAWRTMINNFSNKMMQKYNSLSQLNEFIISCKSTIFEVEAKKCVLVLGMKRHEYDDQLATRVHDLHPSVRINAKRVREIISSSWQLNFDGKKVIGFAMEHDEKEDQMLEFDFESAEHFAKSLAATVTKVVSIKDVVWLLKLIRKDVSDIYYQWSDVKKPSKAVIAVLDALWDTCGKYLFHEKVHMEDYHKIYFLVVRKKCIQTYDSPYARWRDFAGVFERMIPSILASKSAENYMREVVLGEDNFGLPIGSKLIYNAMRKLFAQLNVPVNHHPPNDDVSSLVWDLGGLYIKWLYDICEGNHKFVVEEIKTIWKKLDANNAFDFGMSINNFYMYHYDKQSKIPASIAEYCTKYVLPKDWDITTLDPSL